MGKIRYQSIVRLFSILSIVVLVGCAREPRRQTFKPLTEVPAHFQTQEKANSSEPSHFSLQRQTRITFEKPTFKRLKSGKYLAQYSGSQTLAQYNRPRVPVLKYSFTLAPQMVAELKLQKPRMEISETAIELPRTEKPLVWGKKPFDFGESKAGAYFPGKLFESHQEGNVVFVTVFPMQVEMETGKVLTLVEGEWDLKVQRKKVVQTPAPGSEAALIITSQKMLSGAQDLQKFHAEQLGVKSKIETVESIAKKEEPVPLEDLPEGYKSPDFFEGTVKKQDEKDGSGYQFEVARKIITHLKKRSQENSGLKYVVILGNSEIVPPSYYFLQEETLGPPRTGVTDQCYSAGPQCLEPKLAVGRLPFRNNDEVSVYLQKVKRWKERQPEVKSELSLYGGKAFQSSPFYIGELGTLVTVNHAAADWKNVTKHFQTEGSFSKTDIGKLVSNEDSSKLVYYLDHGMGNRWFAGDHYLTSFEIAATEPAEDSAPPIIVSVSCINGAFDEHLLKHDSVIEDTGKYGVVSVGTALLRSKAGAIAYIGGARDGLGSPETEVDEQGNVQVLGTSYGLQLFDGFVENYRAKNQARLGDVLVQALSDYAFKNGNDMTDANHRWTYWITELLGDPVLPIARSGKEKRSYSPPKSDFSAFDNTSGFPQLALNADREKWSQFPLSTISGPMVAKVYQLELGDEGYSGEKLIKTKEFEASGGGVLKFDANDDLKMGKSYLIKLINLEGVPRENHIMFSTKSSSE